MKRTNRELDAMLREGFATIRNEKIDAATVEESAARVWSQLAARDDAATVETLAGATNRIDGCAGFQSLMPAYLRGELNDSRALLLKDHTHECIPCRRALKVARAAENGEAESVRRIVAPSRVSVLRAGVTSYPAWRWAMAAMLLIVISLVGLPLINRLPHSGMGATVHAANGTLYRISEQGLSAILPGETIALGESVRTARDANAIVRLRDGSLIEMKERSGFSVSENANGTTLHLESGNLIVQAAPQDARRHLYVETNDCLVSVVGTIFSVNNGTRGSRVSVIEGEVHVDRAGEAESVLRPGDQVTTSERLERVPVMQEVAWSRDRERYAQILESLRGMRRDLDAQIQRPGLRYSTRLLDAMPEGTVLYAALPNLTGTIADSYRLMQERVRDNPALREWWQDERASVSNNRVRLDEMIERVREFGTHLGGEIVVGAEMSAAGHPDIPFVIAELSNNGEGFRSYLENQAAQFGANANRNAPRVTIVDDPRATGAASPTGATNSSPNAANNSSANRSNELFVWIRNDVVVAATRRDQLARIAANLEGGSANPFTNTSFHARLASVYREGAGLIVAADLERIMPRALRFEPNENRSADEVARREEGLRQLGVLRMKHVIVELKETNGRAVNRAVLSFNEPNRGMASWLAAPGPMRALEFISPDANAVAAFVVKEPTALVDDLLNTIGTMDPEVLRHLRETEAQHGMSLREDFAAPLGGEFAFALDGPILPVPSWKMIIEVYDPARLQATLERTVERANEWARREGKQGFVWERSEAGGQTFYALRSQDFGVSINYAYVNGYMIVAPTRSLVERAINLRDTGTTLLRAATFQATLPPDGQANFSAVFYQNLAPVVRPLVQRMGAGGANNSDEAREYRRRLERLSVLPPMLAYAYANEDGQITFSAGSDEGPFGLNPGSFLGLPASFGIPQMLSGGQERE